MSKLRTVSLIAALAPMLAACAPSPDDLCEHLIGLMKAELGEEVDAMSDEQLTKIEASCVADAKADKATSAKDFKRRAECVMAADSLEAVRACERSEKPAKSE